MNSQAAKRGAASGGHDDGYGDYAYEDYQLRPGQHYGDQHAQHHGEQQAQGGQQQYAEQEYYEQEYDPRAYAPNPDEPYGYDDAGNPLFYEHAPTKVKSARNGTTLIAAVLGLAVLGGGGAIGYKMLSSRGLTGGEPPLIRADTEPVKSVPDNKDAGKGPGKAVYDRVETSPSKSKVVSREEEPVDLPSSPTTEQRPDGSRTIVPGGAQAAGGGEEPRRVKTMTIRADQSLIAAAQPVTGTAPSVATPVVTPQAVDPIAEAARTGEAPKSSEFDNGIMADGNTPPKAPAKPAATPKPADTHVANANPQLASTPKPAAQPSTTPRATPVAPQSTATAQTNRPASPAPQAQQPQQQVAAVAPRAPVAAPAASRAGGFVVQVTSQRTEQDARAAYANLQKKFPQVLGSYQASIQSADVGDRGTYYRVRVGPFGNNTDAATVCTNLRAAGGDCVVSRN